jgi:hypothetical protein
MRRLRYLLALVTMVGVLASCSSPDRAPEGRQAAAPIATGSAVPFAVSSPTNTPPPAPTSTPVVAPTAMPISTPPATPTASPERLPTATPETLPTAPPAFCPVTPPPDPPFVPPTPVKLLGGNDWFGTEALWTQSRSDGEWPTPSHMAKFFWWRRDYDPTKEPQPNLIVTGRRLDAPAPLVTSGRATNAYNASDIGSAMLTGFILPSAGCWEITGKYEEATTVTFVIRIGP